MLKAVVNAVAIRKKVTAETVVMAVTAEMAVKRLR